MDKLFITSHSSPVKYGNVVRLLERRLNIKFPTPTMVRKIGSTAAVKSCAEPEARLVLCQLSHDPHVGAKHYQAITGGAAATKAFSTMEISLLRGSL